LPKTAHLSNGTNVSFLYASGVLTGWDGTNGLAKKEKKMKRKLAKLDSAKAEQTFDNIDAQYGKMIAAINGDSLPAKRGSGAYMPMVDSVKTSLAFLNQNSSVLSQSKEVQDKLKGLLSEVNQLQGKLQQADQVKAFIHRQPGHGTAVVHRHKTERQFLSQWRPGIQLSTHYIRQFKHEHGDALE
jgi:hypothetical protein